MKRVVEIFMSGVLVLIGCVGDRLLVSDHDSEVDACELEARFDEGDIELSEGGSMLISDSGVGESSNEVKISTVLGPKIVEIDAAIRVHADMGMSEGDAGKDASIGDVVDASDIVSDALADHASLDSGTGTDEDSGQFPVVDSGPSSPDLCDPPGGIVYDCSEKMCEKRDGWPDGWADVWMRDAGWGPAWCPPPGWPVDVRDVAYSPTTEVSILMPGSDEAYAGYPCSGTDIRIRFVVKMHPDKCAKIIAPEGSVVRFEYDGQGNAADGDRCAYVSTWLERGTHRCFVATGMEVVAVYGQGTEYDPMPPGWLHIVVPESCGDLSPCSDEDL